MPLTQRLQQTRAAASLKAGVRSMGLGGPLPASDLRWVPVRGWEQVSTAGFRRESRPGGSARGGSLGAAGTAGALATRPAVTRGRASLSR